MERNAELFVLDIQLEVNYVATMANIFLQSRQSSNWTAYRLIRMIFMSHRRMEWTKKQPMKLLYMLAADWFTHLP